MAGEKGRHKKAARDLKTPPVERKSRLYLTPGQLVGGNYEIIEQIGEGGMAIVYRAIQKSLNRSVAIKALHPRYSRDSNFVERFEAESGALAALSHPNIVTIIDRGAEGEVFYFVMEHVDGEDLDKKIIANTVKRASDWRGVILACSEALTYCHKRGLVHRDMKPSNILVSSEGQVKIGDFGIAHIVRGDAAMEEPTQSGSNRPVGTAYYMAPEQSSDPQHVDHRADIYSLAVAFYKMMTRRLPTGEFAAPSELNTDIPTAVDAVIFQALAPNREDRYQSVKEFCDELQSGLKEKSVSITSIFNYRTSPGASSLYSGDDFKVMRAPGSGEDIKTPGTSSGKTNPTTSGGLRRPKTGVLANTPLPKPKPKPKEKTSAFKKEPSTPPPPGTKVPAVAGKNETGEKKKKPAMPVKLIVVALVLVVAGAILGAVAVYMNLQNQPPSPDPNAPSVPITGAVSPALEREQRERLEREKQQEQIIESEEAKMTPAPDTVDPLP